MQNLLLLYGGKSAEHDVSIVSANSLIAGFYTTKYHIIPLKINRDGRWNLPIESKNDFDQTLHSKLLFPEIKEAELFTYLTNQIDVVFPLLHGTYGEDGTIQGFFEILGKPYVGAGVLGSAVGMDKGVAKILLESNQIPVVPYVIIDETEYKSNPDHIVRLINDKLNYPLFVKPCNSGSSIGITKVKSLNNLHPALVSAFKFDWRILIETGLTVHEIEVSVLGNDKVEVSLPGQIHPAAEFYDYEDKYKSGASWSEIPAKLDSDTIKNIQSLAAKIYRTLCLNGFARIDFFIEKETGMIYLNEVNTIPGFTPISMYPKMWEASGLPYSDLIEKLIGLAFDYFNKRKKIADNFLNIH